MPEFVFASTSSQKRFHSPVRKAIVIQLFQLRPQIGNQVSLFMDGQALIAQLAKQTDKLLSKSASLWYASERFDCGLYSVTTVLSLLWAMMLK